MTITVGTDSYVSVADARTYLASVDKALPASNDAAESLLKRATLAIDRIYGDKFIGIRYSSNPLEWPRLANYMGPGSANVGDIGGYGYSNTGRYLEAIPREVQQATAEMAIMLDSDVDPYVQPEAAVQNSTITVDVITIAQTTSGARVSDPLYNVGLILKPVVRSGSSLRLDR